MTDGVFFRTEAAAIRHIFHLSRSEGCWPGYVRVAGGFRTTYEPDELAPAVALDDDGTDDGEPGDYDGQADDDGNDGFGPWLDSYTYEAAGDDEAA